MDDDMTLIEEEIGENVSSEDRSSDIFDPVDTKNSQSSFNVVLYKDKDKMLLLEYYAATATVVDQLPGQTVEKKRFNKKYKVVVMENNKINRISIDKKKEVTKQFQKYGDYTKWCKSNKRKTNSYESLVTFLKENG